MGNDTALRGQLARMLSWEDAHVGFDRAVGGLAEPMRGKKPSGLHSPWELLEHLRRTQHDILEFCRNTDYQELEWPEDYWPPTPQPPSPGAWDESAEEFRRDRAALEELAADTRVDLHGMIPHGTGQTYLRELLLAADHTAYHVGQLILVRELLDAWPR